jgi:Flp pilus assembly protein TadD
VRHGDLVDAERSLRTAVEGNPANAHFRADLSRVLVRLQRVDEARSLAEEAVTLDPKNTGLRTHLQDLV